MKKSTKTMAQTINDIATARGIDVAVCLDNFLDFAIALNDTGNFYSENFAKSIGDKLNSDADFGSLFLDYSLRVEKAMSSGTWADPLGEAYEELASGHKRSALGQFFTPKGMCDLMAQLSIDERAGYGGSVSDPAAGSGRTLLAMEMARDRSGRVYYHAEDRDPICAKMCAVNMMIHGMHGMVVQHDTLLQDFVVAYYINEVRYPIRVPGFVSVRRITSREEYERINSAMLRSHKNCHISLRKSENDGEGK